MRITLYVLFGILVSICAKSQVLVSQNPNGTAHGSSQFEVRSNQKGFLPPVMTTQERKNIVNPAEGLLVFDSTRQLLFVYTKMGWHSFNLSPESSIISNGTAFPNPGFNTNDQAGHKVEILGDYAYLGAWASTISGKVEQGAVYMYKMENGAWNFISKIIAADGQAGDYFGTDISATGEYVFIGASGDSYGENITQGSVYIYKWVNNALVYQNKITGTSASSGDRFGFDIEAKGNLLVIGAILDDIGENANQGSVYFYELEGANWVEEQKYFATANTGSNHLFGRGIFIDGNFVTVGNDLMNTSGNYGFNRNRISIFSKDGDGIWTVHSEILNPTGQNFEGFGYSTTLKNDILTVSAPHRDMPTGNKDRGVVYVYKRNAMAWNLVQTIAPTDSSLNDTYGDYLGFHTDRDGNLLVIGSSFEDFGASQNDYGGAFVYEWNGNQFVPLKKLRSAIPQVQEWFGHGIAIHNGNIVVGAPGKNTQAGGGYFFKVE